MSQAIAGIENRGDGERVGDPDQAHGNGHVARRDDCHYGRYDHLAGDGHESAQNTDHERPGNRLAGQVPQVRVMQVTPEPAEMTMAAKHLFIGHVFSKQLARHRGQIYRF